MANISTFGTFTTIKLGIYAASHGLSVTGNNISNVNTTGYTRQYIDQKSNHVGGSDRYLSKNDIRIGNGVMVTGVGQMRDMYLDIQYRNEMASVGAMDAKLSGLDRVSGVLDEVFKGQDESGHRGPGVIEAGFNDLIEQIQNLNTQGAGQEYYDTLVRSSAESLCNKFKLYATGLETAYDNELTAFKANVGVVNSILERIRDLNEEIRRANVYGSDALEQKDERNNLIDQLSSYARIDVEYATEYIDEENNHGVEKLTIKLKNNDTQHPAPSYYTIVDGIYATKFSIDQEPKLDENGNQVYEKDDDGNFLLDENGEPVPATQDSEYLTLSIGPLRDKRYNTMVYDSKVTKTESFYDMDTAFASKPDGSIDTENAKRTYYDVVTRLEKGKPELTIYEKQPGTVDVKTGFASEQEALDYISAGLKDGSLKYKTFEDDGKTIKELNKYTAEDDGAGGFKVVKATSKAVSSFADEATAKKALEDAIAAGDISADSKYVKDEDANTYHIEGTRVKYVLRTIEEDVSVEHSLSDNFIHGALQSQREVLAEVGEYTDKDIVAGLDPNSPAKRGIRFYQLALDSLANKFAEVMNNCNGNKKTEETVTEEIKFEAPVRAVKVMDGSQNPATALKDANGKDIYLKVAQKGDGKWYFLNQGECALKGDALMLPNGGELPTDQTVSITGDQLDHFRVVDGAAAGKAHGIELTEADFNGKDFTDYKNVEVVKEWVTTTKTVWTNGDDYDAAKGFGHKPGVLISNNNNYDIAEGITASNISVSHSWSIGETRIVQSFTSPGSTAGDNYTHLISQLQAGEHAFCPSDIGYDDALNSGVAFYKGTIQGMLTDMNEKLSNDQKVAATMLDNYTITSDELWVERDSVSGVDLNDEAMNMMQYQKAYAAACRMMTAFDEILDKLINGTAV